MAARFQELLPAHFLAQVEAEAGVKRNNSVYSPLVVLWLLVAQRLGGGASLGDAVLELLRGLPASFWPQPCKRIRDWREHGNAPSSNTGAYNQARQALPLSIVQKSCDHIFEQLVAELSRPAPDSRRAFLLDGSSLRAAHTPELCAAYPPGSNRYGQSHWPVIRLLVAHDLETGLAMRPEWGPMYGGEAISEQALLERAIDRLPSGSTVMGDANFGVFSVAHAAAQREHPVLLRLTAERARRLAGEVLRDGIEREMVWKPSRHDRKSHPDLPEDARVKGRLLVRQVQPNDGGAAFLLCFFTTLSSPVEEIYQLYGQRWMVETDLRTLKSTLCLDQLTSATRDMVAKEIEMGITAYNLVRALIGVAAQQSGIPPRGYSFSKVRRILEVFGPALANAPDQKSADRVMQQIMRCVQQSKLPRRKRPSYPREVWQRGGYFPTRKK
ncbi:MAG TPA: IS4 family transposase [Candidatus Sulfotelmatobacter sp.]|nr:IS4 family transposase [Candidatus Sulfotelmatobacter sp.]HWI59365.1 IS4 family transposase [Bacillota bacterium]